MAADPEPSRARPPGWRLADRPSQYLRSAAEQAIEWYPWGTEPFELAKRLNRPVLLDIGAAWCHWCHVMDEGTYSDAQVARILAQSFVAVKVDRDEHPEVDRRYQRQVGALTGEGGWPLTAFLTPDGEAFLGGTYFPVEDGLGRPGFRRVLKEVSRIWTERPEAAQRNVAAARESLSAPDRRGVGAPVAAEPFVASTLERIDASYDPVHAGFGHHPKFPHPTAVSLYLWRGHVHGDARADARARETLRRMAEGGMYDQLGGGFHRYSVDEAWHIPHFEKMAEDNGALLSAYVEGAGRFDDPILDETAAGIVRWTEETLAVPGGGLAASQDADNAPGDDGGYFTWSRPELKALLAPDELRLVVGYFGLGTDGRMPHDLEQNVLYRQLPVSELARAQGRAEPEAERLLASATAKMRAARGQRPAPKVDTALYASLNGVFLRGLANAARRSRDPRALALARGAADRFLRDAYAPEVGVAHRLEGARGAGHGLLEDQVAFGLGLAELAAVTLDRRYAETAAALADLSDARFRDPGGLLRDIAPSLYDGPVVGGVGDPTFPLEDHPHLSANAGYALLQIRLSALLEAPERRERARDHLAHLMPRVAGLGIFAAGTALAAALLETPAARVVVEGEGPAVDRLARAAERTYHPRLDVFRGLPEPPFSLPGEVRAASGRRSEGARALVCFGTRCLAPITDAGELRRVLASAAPGAGS